MAYSASQWERAKAYWEAGQHNPREISELVGIERSTIVKRAKSHNWKSGANADYIEAKTKIAVKKSQLNSQTLQVLDDIADEQIRHKQLINSNAELMATKIPEMIRQMILIEEDKETGEVKESLAISPSDLKLLAETNDRLAITLKVAERHAPKMEISATAGIQQTKYVGFTKITDEEFNKALAENGR
jgi:hypothetical protein